MTAADGRRMLDDRLQTTAQGRRQGLPSIDPGRRLVDDGRRLKVEAKLDDGWWTTDDGSSSKAGAKA